MIERVCAQARGGEAAGGVAPPHTLRYYAATTFRYYDITISRFHDTTTSRRRTVRRAKGLMVPLDIKTYFTTRRHHDDITTSTSHHEAGEGQRDQLQLRDVARHPQPPRRPRHHPQVHHHVPARTATAEQTNNGLSFFYSGLLFFIVWKPPQAHRHAPARGDRGANQICSCNGLLSLIAWKPPAPAATAGKTEHT